MDLKKHDILKSSFLALISAIGEDFSPEMFQKLALETIPQIPFKIPNFEIFLKEVVSEFYLLLKRNLEQSQNSGIQGLKRGFGDDWQCELAFSGNISSFEQLQCFGLVYNHFLKKFFMKGHKINAKQLIFNFPTFLATLNTLEPNSKLNDCLLWVYEVVFERDSLNYILDETSQATDILDKYIDLVRFVKPRKKTFELINILGYRINGYKHKILFDKLLCVENDLYQEDVWEACRIYFMLRKSNKNGFPQIKEFIQLVKSTFKDESSYLMSLALLAYSDDKIIKCPEFFEPIISLVEENPQKYIEDCFSHLTNCFASNSRNLEILLKPPISALNRILSTIDRFNNSRDACLALKLFSFCLQKCDFPLYEEIKELISRLGACQVKVKSEIIHCLISGATINQEVILTNECFEKLFTYFKNSESQKIREELVPLFEFYSKVEEIKAEMMVQERIFHLIFHNESWILSIKLLFSLDKMELKKLFTQFFKEFEKPKNEKLEVLYRMVKDELFKFLWNEINIFEILSELINSDAPDYELIELILPRIFELKLKNSENQEELLKFSEKIIEVREIKIPLKLLNVYLSNENLELARKHSIFELCQKNTLDIIINCLKENPLEALDYLWPPVHPKQLKYLFLLLLQNESQIGDLLEKCHSIELEHSIFPLEEEICTGFEPFKSMVFWLRYNEDLNSNSPDFFFESQQPIIYSPIIQVFYQDCKINIICGGRCFTHDLPPFKWNQIVINIEFTIELFINGMQIIPKHTTISELKRVDSHHIKISNDHPHLSIGNLATFRKKIGGEDLKFLVNLSQTFMDKELAEILIFSTDSGYLTPFDCFNFEENFLLILSKANKRDEIEKLLLLFYKVYNFAVTTVMRTNSGDFFSCLASLLIKKESVIDKQALNLLWSIFQAKSSNKLFSSVLMNSEFYSSLKYSLRDVHVTQFENFFENIDKSETDSSLSEKHSTANRTSRRNSFDAQSSHSKEFIISSNSKIIFHSLLEIAMEEEIVGNENDNLSHKLVIRLFRIIGSLYNQDKLTILLGFLPSKSYNKQLPHFWENILEIIKSTTATINKELAQSFLNSLEFITTEKVIKKILLLCEQFIKENIDFSLERLRKCKNRSTCLETIKELSIPQVFLSLIDSPKEAKFLEEITFLKFFKESEYPIMLILKAAIRSESKSTINNIKKQIMQKIIKEKSIEILEIVYEDEKEEIWNYLVKELILVFSLFEDGLTEKDEFIFRLIEKIFNKHELVEIPLFALKERKYKVLHLIYLFKYISENKENSKCERIKEINKDIFEFQVPIHIICILHYSWILIKE